MNCVTTLLNFYSFVDRKEILFLNSVVAEFSHAEELPWFLAALKFQHPQKGKNPRVDLHCISAP
jgi:hypothetical protein